MPAFGAQMVAPMKADFFRIKMWNSQTEAAAENLVKGRRIAVEGSLRQDSTRKKAKSVAASPSWRGGWSTS